MRFPIDWVRGPMQTALYDLEEDPQQQRNLADEQPDKVRRLQAALRHWLVTADAPVEQRHRLGLE
jgi:hypothetical protein